MCTHVMFDVSCSAWFVLRAPVRFASQRVAKSKLSKFSMGGKQWGAPLREGGDALLKHGAVKADLSWLEGIRGCF